jgi:hypothetical protein
LRRRISRATNATFTAGLVTTIVAANATSFQSTGLAASTTYFYRVRAVNRAGASANSATAGATTQAAGSATTTHVEAITVVTVSAGQGKKRAVTVRDNLGAVVPNAIVSGAFTGSISGAGSATTNASGVAMITTTSAAGGNVNVTFCVSGILHAMLTYNSAANVETCDHN